MLTLPACRAACLASSLHNSCQEAVSTGSAARLQAMHHNPPMTATEPRRSNFLKLALDAGIDPTHAMKCRQPLQAQAGRAWAGVSVCMCVPVHAHVCAQARVRVRVRVCAHMSACVGCLCVVGLQPLHSQPETLTGP